MARVGCPRAVRGMYDQRGGWLRACMRVEDAVAGAARARGFEGLRTPPLEEELLFARALPHADAAHKELFRLEGGLCARPEGTAAVVRHLLRPSHASWAPLAPSMPPGLQVHYAGPMLRHERPQRLRMRHFTQAGVEWLAPPSRMPHAPLPDALLLSMLADVFTRLRLPARLLVNHLGCPSERAAYAASLQAHLRARPLSTPSEARMHANPQACLRILDSKHPLDLAAVSDAPLLGSFLGAESRRQLEELQGLLGEVEVEVEVEERLVRGLDYYSGIVFEAVPPVAHGQQAALAAGGRYDGLTEMLGGPPMEALGWALGVERVAASLEAAEEQRGQSVVVCLLREVGERGGERQAMRLVDDVAKSMQGEGGEGTAPRVQLRVVRSARKALHAALAEEASVCVFLGQQELEKGVGMVKLLATHEQTEVPLADLADHLAQLRK